MWNIEKIRQGLKSNWNYIDGVMIKAVLQMYDVTRMRSILSSQIIISITEFTKMEQ